MMKFSSYLYIRLLCWLLLLIGLLFANLRCEKPQPETLGGQIKKQQVSLAVLYEDKIRHLQKHSDSLSRQFKIQQQQFVLYKQQVLMQKFRVLQRVSHETSQRDTLQKLIDCDSLQDEVQVYISLAEKQDSLCGAQLQNLTEQIAVKDSAQNACASYADKMNLLLNISTDAQQQMEKQITSLNKKIRNKTRVNRFLTAGAFVLSGVMLTALTR